MVRHASSEQYLHTPVDFVFLANVYFTKVDALCVLRPQLVHLDALNDQNKSALRMQAGADTEENEAFHVNMTIKKSEGDSADSVGDISEVAKLLKAMREEPWQRLSWIDCEVCLMSTDSFIYIMLTRM